MILASGGSVAVLANLPSPPQGVWNLGPLPIRAYALWIILGIVVACWWGERRWVARGGRPGVVIDTAIWAVPFGLVGGRIYHVATDYWRYFGEGRNPADVFKIWDGGLGIWGAVAFGAVGALIGLRQQGIRPVGAFADSIAPGIIVAQGIGRLGNYFNQELYGRETDVPWALEIYRRFDPETNLYGLTAGRSTGEVVAVVHPTFLYELVWNVLVAVALVLLDRKLRLGHGRVFALYVALYCFGRFFVEGLRADEATMVFDTFRINEVVAVVVFLCAMAYVVLAKKGRETPEEIAAQMPGTGEDTDAVEADGSGTDSRREPGREPGRSSESG